MNVMIVDDSAAMRKIIRDICFSFAEKIVECVNGFEAIKTYENFLPHLVLMDIKMPEMNGLEAMKKILEKHPNAKIIIITQYKEKELEEEAKKFGAYAFLLKENLSDLETILNSKGVIK